MEHSRQLRRNGVWVLYERLGVNAKPTTLGPRWFVVKRHKGQPVWLTVKYFHNLREAEEALCQKNS